MWLLEIMHMQIYKENKQAGKGKYKKNSLRRYRTAGNLMLSQVLRDEKSKERPDAKRNKGSGVLTATCKRKAQATKKAISKSKLMHMD